MWVYAPVKFERVVLAVRRLGGVSLVVRTDGERRSNVILMMFSIDGAYDEIEL